MTEGAKFSRPGAVDLSELAAKSAQASPAGGASYVLEVAQADLPKLAQSSMRYPVLLLLIMGSDAGCRQVANDLTQIVNSMGGQLVLAINDVEKDPSIAQAIGAQGVPMGVVMLSGQLAPVFQGTKDAAELKDICAKVHQAAVANGMTGRAEAVSAADAANGEAEKPVDPRFAAADDALSRGDFAAAVAEFDKLLKANPNDREAQAGKAQAGLLARTINIDPQALALADEKPADIELAMQAADFELLNGQASEAFTRLINLIKQVSPDEREPIRVRLVELFSTCDPADPVVKKARRELAMALF